MNRNLVLSRSLIASIIPAAALATAGIATTAPAQAATTTSVTAATAGTKALGATTYMWGTSNAPAGTTVCSQVSLNANWSTSQCSTIKADHSYSVELTYGKTTPGTYTFRAITQAANGVVTATSSPVTLTRGSSTPATPTKPSTTDYVKGRFDDGSKLSYGENGVKVYLVQKALGIPTSAMSSKMDSQTTTAVSAFQKQHGLPVTGAVDANTYYALKALAPHKEALTNYDFNVDSWKAPSTTKPGDSHATKVNKMIAWAKAQYGKPYIWGGTGPMGYDCSGLLLQALRAGGFSPKNVDNDIDVRPASDLSNQMWNDKEFTKVSTGNFLPTNIQPGDMIYYSDRGVVDHVAMYVGNGQIINAVKAGVTYAGVKGTQRHAAIVGVNRMP